MAFFEGTIQEFHHFVGPRIRNQINTKTKKVRNSKNGICEHCSNKRELESAHIHGKGRRTIIEDVLSSHLVGGLVKIELSEIENEIIDKHNPIDQTFKFLCKSCHTKYDEPFKKKSNFRKTTTSINTDIEFPKLYKIELWAKKPLQNNAKILSAFMSLIGNGSVTIAELSKLCNNPSSRYYIKSLKSFKSSYSSMKTNSGNSNGHVFDDDGEYVIMPTVVREEVEKYWDPNLNQKYT